MLKKILILVLFACAISTTTANVPLNTSVQSEVFLPAKITGGDGTGVFSAGDTTVSIDVSNARKFMFALKDSSMSGADSLKAYLKFKSGGVTFYAPLAVHDVGQVTNTTNTLIMSPGDGLAGAYVFAISTFAGSDQLFTGTIYIQRTNTRTGEAVYAPKTRYWYSWE